MSNPRVQVDKIPGPSRLQVSQVAPDTYFRPALDPNAGSEFLQMANALSEFRPGLNQFLGVTVKEAENKELQKGYADRMAARSDPNAQNPNASGFYARAWNEADATIRAEDYSSDVFNAVRNSDLWNKENADPAEFDKVVTPIREKYQAAGKPGGDLWATTFGQRIVSAESSVKALWLNRLQQVRQEQAVNALSITVGNKLTYAMENQNLSPEQIAGILQTEVDGLSSKFNVDKSVASRAVAEGFKSFFTQMTRNESTIGQFDRFVRVFQNMKTDEGPMANTAFGHDVLDHAYGVQSYAESTNSRMDEERKKDARTAALGDIMTRTRSLSAAELATREVIPDGWADAYIKAGGSPSTATEVYRMTREGRLNPINTANKDAVMSLRASIIMQPETVDYDESVQRVLAAQSLGSINPTEAAGLLSQLTTMKKQAAMLSDEEYKRGLSNADKGSTLAEAEIKTDAVGILKTRMSADPELKKVLEFGQNTPGNAASAMVFQRLGAVDLTPAREHATDAYYNSINHYLSSNNLVWESLNTTQKLQAIGAAKDAYAETFKLNAQTLIVGAQKKAEDQARGVLYADNKAKDATEKAAQTLTPEGHLTYRSSKFLKTYGGLYREVAGAWKTTVGQWTGLADVRSMASVAESTKHLMATRSGDLTPPSEIDLAKPQRNDTVLQSLVGSVGYFPAPFVQYVQYNQGRDHAVGMLAKLKSYVDENKYTALDAINEKGTGWFHPINAYTVDSVGDALQAIHDIRLAYGMESFSETLKLPKAELEPHQMLLIPVSEWSPENMLKLVDHLGIIDPKERASVIEDQTRFYNFHKAWINNPAIEKLGPDLRDFIHVENPDLFPQLQGKEHHPNYDYRTREGVNGRQYLGY